MIEVTRRPTLVGRHVWVDGLRMHYLVSRPSEPVGPPLVLVHGFGVAGSYWVRLAERLSPRHRVFVPDLPGHGNSDKPGAALDVRGLTLALERWMDSTAIGVAGLIANSLGCQIVTDFASRHPERVRCLVLAGPTVDPAARSAWRQIARLALSAPGEDPRLLFPLLTDYPKMGLRRLRAEFGHMLRDRIEERLPGIAAPTLVIRGTWDRVAPREWAGQVVRLLPAGELVEVPGAGHAAHHGRADEVAREVMRFVGRWTT